MPKKHWEHFPNEADMGVRGIGASLEEDFEQAALALTAVITDPHMVAPQEVVEISCEAPDVELLFAEWLNALIYEMTTRKLLFARYEVHLSDHHLWARAWGEPIEPSRHQPAVEVKGATKPPYRLATPKTVAGWLSASSMYRYQTGGKCDGSRPTASQVGL